jgi:hypothetical protein
LFAAAASSVSMAANASASSTRCVRQATSVAIRALMDPVANSAPTRGSR